MFFFPSQHKFQVQNKAGKDFQRCQIPVLSCAFKGWSLYSVAPGMSSQSPKIGRFRKQKKQPEELHVAKQKYVYIQGGPKMSYERPLLKWPARSDLWCHKKVFCLKKSERLESSRMFVFLLCWSYIFLLGRGRGEDSWSKKNTEFSPHKWSWHDLARIFSVLKHQTAHSDHWCLEFGTAQAMKEQHTTH